MTSLAFGRLTARRSRRGLAAASALMISLAFGPNHALAATDTATLSVTANVQSGCAVSGGTLDFGNYQSGQTANRDAVGTISYTNCIGTIEFELDGGQSGNVNSRAMRSGSSSLSYQLYRNSQRNSIFGTGANAQPVLLLEVTSETLNVYGRIPGNQSVAAGSYSDTVNITLTF